MKELQVALTLFKDYSEPFVFTKAVPSNPKIPNFLPEFYKQVDFIENATKQQSNSLLWKDMLIGRITDSIVYDVLHTNIDKT